MRSLVLFSHSSLDGLVQGPTPWDLSWIRYGPDLEGFAAHALSTASTVVWGRVTYEGMLSHWTTVPGNPDSSAHERQHAAWLEGTDKVVVSTTVRHSDWARTRFIADHVPEAIAQLKREGGGDIVVMGSPSVAHTLMQRDLIDEYRLTVSPVVLGGGTPLFAPGGPRQDLHLVASTPFPSGLLGLTYRRTR